MARLVRALSLGSGGNENLFLIIVAVFIGACGAHTAQCRRDALAFPLS
jgi:hypothetical protein